MEQDEKIRELVDFAALIRRYFAEDEPDFLRSEINQRKRVARRLVIEAGAFKTYTIGPPPAIGGLIMRDVDVFEYIFEDIYLSSMNPQLFDMIDEAIGSIKSGTLDDAEQNRSRVKASVRQGYAFIAMAIDANDPSLADVLDTIKQAAHSCGIQAERIDEQGSNERITDRILESIRVAEFVIADLTHSRPNVFYEAGYALGYGKIPIYVARGGTKLEFDIKDYPVIFFENLRSLREQLGARLQRVAGQRH